jgi:hypothetical protein
MAAYVNDLNQSENVVYVDSKGQLVHAVLVKGTGWVRETVAKDNHPQTDVAAFVFPIQNTEHIIYVDKLGRLVELLRNTPSGTGIGSWHTNVDYIDQGLILPGLNQPSPLTAWVFPDATFPNSTEHFVYAKNYPDDTAWWTEFYYSNASGVSQIQQLPAQVGAGDVAQTVAYYPSITSYQDNPAGIPYEHIVYLKGIDEFSGYPTELFTSQNEHPNWIVNPNVNGFGPNGIDRNGGLIGVAEGNTEHVFGLCNNSLIEGWYTAGDPAWSAVISSRGGVLRGP